MVVLILNVLVGRKTSFIVVNQVELCLVFRVSLIGGFVAIDLYCYIPVLFLEMALGIAC